MAITNSTEGVWVNLDTLRVKFPQATLKKSTGGEYNMLSSQHLTEFDVDFTQVALGTDDTHVYILDYEVVIPNTAVVEKVEFITGTAWATDTAINFGTVRRSDFTTIIDADGLVNSIILGVRDLAGETTAMTAGGTYAGAQVGVQGIDATYDCVVCTYWEGAAPTAGTGQLKIYWTNAPVSINVGA